MKKLLNLILLLTIINPLFSDYSSLTKNEKSKVLQAFKQAKFYKYYESLATGSDTIKIVETKKVKVTQTKKGYTQTYDIAIIINIKDKQFHRDLTVDLQYNKDGSIDVSIYDQVKLYSVPVAIGFIVGVLFGIIQ